MPPTFLFLRQGLSLPCVLPNRPGLLANEPQGSTYLASPGLGLQTGATKHIPFFIGSGDLTHVPNHFTD